MIDLTDWIKEMDRLDRGETVRVNHTDCSAGQDTRRRLYLTRPAASPDMVLGYCHNCQDKGVRKHDAHDSVYRAHDHPVENINLCSDEEFSAPKNLVLDPDEWPTEAHAWRIKARLDAQTCLNMGISYDPSTHRIYLPMFDTIYAHPGRESVLEGFQLRRLSDRGPKYLTAIKDEARPPSTVMIPGIEAGEPQRRIAVLVEDMASGIAVAEACLDTAYHVEVVVNYGTRVTPEILSRVTEYEKGLVWLDNDSPHVREQAQKIARVWRMLSGSYVAIECSEADPKKLKDEKIYDIVDEHMNG